MCGSNAPGRALVPGEQGIVSIYLRFVRRTPVIRDGVSASTQTISTSLAPHTKSHCMSIKPTDIGIQRVKLVGHHESCVCKVFHWTQCCINAEFQARGIAGWASH